MVGRHWRGCSSGMMGCDTGRWSLCLYHNRGWYTRFTRRCLIERKMTRTCELCCSWCHDSSNLSLLLVVESKITFEFSSRCDVVYGYSDIGQQYLKRCETGCSIVHYHYFQKGLLDNKWWTISLFSFVAHLIQRSHRCIPKIIANLIQSIHQQPVGASNTEYNTVFERLQPNRPAVLW